jgi:hypothetical protein
MVALVRAARELRGERYRTAENLVILNAHQSAGRGPRRVCTDGLQSGPSPGRCDTSGLQRLWMELRVQSYSTPLPNERLTDSSSSSYALDTLGPGQPWPVTEIDGDPSL